MNGRDECEEENKEGLWIKVGDCNGSGFGGGGSLMRLEIVFLPFVSAGSLSEWQGLSVISFSSSNPSLLPHKVTKRCHIYLCITIVEFIPSGN